MNQRDIGKLIWTGGGKVPRLLFCTCKMLVIGKKGKGGSKEDIMPVDEAGGMGAKTAKTCSNLK